MANTENVLSGGSQLSTGNTGAEPLRQDSNHTSLNSKMNDGLAATLLEEDPFSSEASKILFNGVDDLRRCGAPVDLSLPQLVIVGAQSAGKSSLLRSLTDIPFPVGAGLCTRFATRVISRRSPPDTSDNVKVSIERGDSVPFEGQLDDQEEPFNPHVPSMTAEVFEDIFRQAGEYMGITETYGVKKSNFSSHILRIELSGPTRSHFGILDVPGIFQALTNDVKKEEMKRVRAMVISHMKKPENVIICVAPATETLANQTIFTLADKYAQSSRVVGVFTKCDRASEPELIVQAVRDNKEITLHNGWFVVQNLPEDAPPTLDHAEEEKATFSNDPWLGIPAKQRGTAELKKFLANTLSTRIRKAFPDVQRRIKELLVAEHGYLISLGEERAKREKRREYLLKVLGRYHELARDSLTGPERLPADAMKLRGLTRIAMENFANDLELRGHLHDFTDLPTIGDGKSLDQDFDQDPLYEEIRRQISVNQGEELTGMTNPAVMKPLFVRQTSKWESFGKSYLEEVIRMSKKVALLILDYTASEFGAPDHTSSELKSSIDEFEAQAGKSAILKLREFCHKNSTFLLATTNPSFMVKVRDAQQGRFVAAMLRYSSTNPAMNFFLQRINNDEEGLKQLEIILGDLVVIDPHNIEALLEQAHPRGTRNTEDEIHDLLKAYYEVALEHFKSHVIRIAEEFLHDPKGPVLGLSDKYVLNLEEEQVDILGGEDESDTNNRNETRKRIKHLEEAMKIAGETWRKSMQIER